MLFDIGFMLWRTPNSISFGSRYKSLSMASWQFLVNGSGFCQRELDREVDDSEFFIPLGGPKKYSLSSTPEESVIIFAVAHEGEAANFLSCFIAPFHVTWP
jgi:hypothetical protein